MSADRPLSARYEELVFPDKDWSPTVGQTIAFINLSEGAVIDDDLLAALDKKPTSILPKPSEYFRSYNELGTPQHRKTVGKFALVALKLDVLHSPSSALTEMEELDRRSVLANAVMKIGLAMPRAIPTE